MKKISISPSLLMQNDWVDIGESRSSFHQVTEVLGYNSDNEPGAIRVRMYQDFYYDDEVKGVLLTENHLLKNGMEQMYVGSGHCYAMPSHPDIAFVVVEPGDTRYPKMSVCIEAGKPYIRCTVSCVHEVQHHLRDYGLVDIADNFKL